MSGNGGRQGFMVDWVHTAAPSPQKKSPLGSPVKNTFQRFLYSMRWGPLLGVYVNIVVYFSKWAINLDLNRSIIFFLKNGILEINRRFIWRSLSLKIIENL